MAFNPDSDGVNHVNVYSGGKTELGRFLSNFAKTPFVCEDGEFASIEGYWYWLGCNHPRREELRRSFGFGAKKLGRDLRSPDWGGNTPDFQGKIKRAIECKLNSYPAMKALLQHNTLPLKHYYVFGNGPSAKIHFDHRSDWIIAHIASFQEK